MATGLQRLGGGLGRFERPSFYQPMESAKCAEWYLARLRPNSWTVGLYVPKGFEAYARIPHPRWQRVSYSAPGAIFHRGSWKRPVAFDSDPQARDADEGQLIGPWADVLFETLADTCSHFDERCICGLWEGYNVEGPATARFEIGWNLGFLLHSTSRNEIGRYLSNHRGPCPSNVPSMIWPESRSWCVVTPFQFFSTYVAGLYPGEMTVKDASPALAEYQHFHNHIRPHCALDLMTPMEYLRQQRTAELDQSHMS